VNGNPVAVGGRPLLLELLIGKNRVTDKDVEPVLQAQSKHNLTLEEALITAELVTEDEIAKTYSEHFKLPIFSRAEMPEFSGENEVKNLLPEKFARANHVFSLAKKDDSLEIALLDPTDISLAQEIQLYTGLKVNVFVGTLSTINNGLDSLYGVRDAVKEIATELTEEKIDLAQKSEEDYLDLNRIIPETRETQIVRLVNRILEGAIRDKASDIHIEPFPEEMKVRYRIDGVLHEITPPPKMLPLLLKLKAGKLMFVYPRSLRFMARKW
jgi:hypothetical protein